MEPEGRARELVLAGAAGALGLLLPPVFHLLAAGAVLLPMHLPLVAAGFLVRPALSLWLVLLVPLLSSLTTGMPPLLPPVMPLMTLELGAACLVAWVATRRCRWPLAAALPLALLAGILAGGAGTWLAVRLLPLLGLELPLLPALLARAGAALPGYAVQLVGVPLLVGAAGGLQRPVRPGPATKAEFFAGLADRWDDLVDRVETGRALEELLAPWTEAAAGAVVVDAGCGTGHLAAWLSGLPRPPGRLVAIDLSGPMLGRCRSAAPAARLVRADAEDLPLLPNTANLILAMGLLPHLDRPERFLQRALEVLAPGGWLVLLHTAPRRAVNRVHRGQGGVIARDLVPPLRRARRWLRHAGFTPGPGRDDRKGWVASGRRR